MCKTRPRSRRPTACLLCVQIHLPRQKVYVVRHDCFVTRATFPKRCQGSSSTFVSISCNNLTALTSDWGCS